MASRKQKTQKKKAARNAQIEAGYGSKKAVKSALKEAGIVTTDKEAERIIEKTRKGQASLRELLGKAAPKTSREAATKYQRKQRNKAEAGRKATRQRIENRGNERLSELRERDEGAAKHRLHWLKEHGKTPSKVWSDGIVQLSKNQKGDWITMLGYSEKYSTNDKVVMFTMRVSDTIKGVKRYRSGFEGWESMAMEEKKEAIETKFAELTTDQSGQEGTLTGFYISKERETYK